MYENEAEGDSKMTIDDVAAAMELVKDMHFIPASKLVSQMLVLDLDMAYQLVMICRS